MRKPRGCVKWWVPPSTARWSVTRPGVGTIYRKETSRLTSRFMTSLWIWRALFNINGTTVSSTIISDWVQKGIGFRCFKIWQKGYFKVKWILIAVKRELRSIDTNWSIDNNSWSYSFIYKILKLISVHEKNSLSTKFREKMLILKLPLVGELFSFQYVLLI